MKKKILLSGIIFLSVASIVTVQKVNDVAIDIEPALLEIPSYIDEANRHRWVMRGGNFDQSKVLKGRKITKEKFKKQKKYKDAGITSWSNLGPGNIGGRVRAIATYSPRFGDDVIYVGGAAGGIWKSTDGGANWTAQSDFSPSLAVTSIVIHPTNRNTVYASTGEGQAYKTIGLPGAGIFKTTNGGATWSQLISTANTDFLWVNKIAMNPDNSNHLLAVTTNINKNGSPFPFSQFSGEGKLYESLDAGTSWTEVFSNPLGSLTDVEFHESNGDVRTVSGRGDVFVYNSNMDTYDSKKSLLNFYSGRMETTICGSNENVMYALVSTESPAPDGTNFAAIYKSTNGGTTWDFKGAHPEVFRSNTLGSYANEIWADPTDCDEIYFGGVDLWKSTNGGSNITKISNWSTYHDYVNQGIDEEIQLHADQHIIIPAGDYSQFNKKVYIGNDGGIQKADDIAAGNTISILTGWDNLLGSGLEITQYYGISSSPIVNKFGGGAQDGGIQIRQSSQWTQPQTGDGQDMIFHPSDQSIVYANVNNNSLYKSTDGGDTFSFVDSLGESNASLIAPMAMDMTEPDHIYLCGFGLWRYDDQNGSLTQVKAPLDLGGFIPEIKAIDIDDQTGVIWIGYSGGIIEYSTDGGSTWSGDITATQNLFGIPNNTITDIKVIGETNGRQAYITIGGYRLDNIWKIEAPNGQLPTTMDISMDFEMQVNTITHHPEKTDWIYIGTDVGLFASEDAGTNWSVTPLFDANSGPDFENEGPVFTEVSDLEWDFESFAGSYNLIAGTFGRGIWLSSNILPNVFVDKDWSPGSFTFGTRDKPYRPFTQAIEKAENKGSSVIFLKGGDYDNINQPTLFDKRTLIKSEASSSAIIQ